MAFWSSSTLEPLRKFRFTVQIGSDSDVWWAKSVTQPSPDVSITEFTLVNHKIKYPGIVTWNDIDINIVDIGGKGKAFYDNLRSFGYNFAGGDGLKKIQYKKDQIVINKLKGDGSIAEKWTLDNAFIKSIKYSDLDYSVDDLVEVTLTVAYDSAELSTETGTASADTSTD
tara:strand:- start:123 stop:632 length:510 start_codon:yes stop_codon:yes gene_type:complete